MAALAFCGGADFELGIRMAVVDLPREWINFGNPFFMWIYRRYMQEYRGVAVPVVLEQSPPVRSRDEQQVEEEEVVRPSGPPGAGGVGVGVSATGPGAAAVKIRLTPRTPSYEESSTGAPPSSSSASGSSAAASSGSPRSSCDASASASCDGDHDHPRPALVSHFASVDSLCGRFHVLFRSLQSWAFREITASEWVFEDDVVEACVAAASIPFVTTWTGMWFCERRACEGEPGGAPFRLKLPGSRRVGGCGERRRFVGIISSRPMACDPRGSILPGLRGDIRVPRTSTLRTTFSNVS